jgi:hypothetical protein
MHLPQRRPRDGLLRLELGDLQPLEGSDVLSTNGSVVLGELPHALGGESDGCSSDLLGSGLVGLGAQEGGEAALGRRNTRVSVCHIFWSARGIAHDSHASKFVIELLILSLSILRAKLNISRIRSPKTTPCPTCSFIVNPLCFRRYTPRSLLTRDRSRLFASSQVTCRSATCTLSKSLVSWNSRLGGF